MKEGKINIKNIKITQEKENMGQKDLTEKLLEDYEDVFLYTFNGLLFEEDVIEKQYLKP